MPTLIKSLTELKAIVARLKKKGQQIVFTNGCFDLLHEGHLHLIHQAKILGDILILGINTDVSVKNLKGPDRPIQHLKIRIETLSQLEQIDYIIAFNELTPILLIEIIEPNVLIKGGDYVVSEIIGHHLAQQTIVIPLLEGFSTTQKIKNTTLKK